MRYIGDSIGTEYEKWGEGDTVFISSPTGTGKTTFILNIYLPYLAAQGKRMLYLVNRTILKTQLEEEISKLSRQQRLSIDIELYQTIENEISSNDQKIWKLYKGYVCVVCDEAHYFLTDSNYNTNTIWSYNFVRDYFKSKIRIYMSATIEKIKQYVKNDNSQQVFCRTYWFGIHEKDTTRHKLVHNFGKVFEYSAEKDYKYVDVKVLRSRNEVMKVVCDGKDKWLVFVDTKEFGEKLKKDIEKYFSNSEIGSSDKLVDFISSEDNLAPQSKEQINMIVKNKKTSVKILIATSVLDNGVSIQDIKLRNVILFADTEEKFVQMLGRKREDGECLKLYIYAYDRAHFIRRRTHNEEIKKIADKYCKKIINTLEEQSEKLNLGEAQACSGNQIWGENLMQAGDKEHERKTSKWEKMNTMENTLIMIYHAYLMPRILDSEKFYHNIRSIFTVLNGVLYLNLLSVQNIENLSCFYDYLIEKFETDGEDAYLKEQLRWLKKTEDEVDKILTDEKYEKTEESRQKVIKSFETIVDKALPKEKIIRFKQDNKEDFLILVQAATSIDIEDKEKYIDMLKKSDRPISGPFVRELCSEFNIPYVMDVKNGTYTIKKL